MFIFNKEVLRSVVRVFSSILILVFFVAIYFLGLKQGYELGRIETEQRYSAFLDQIDTRAKPTPTPTPTSFLTKSPNKVNRQRISWGGPELWSAVNKRRVEYGVNPLIQRDELCTIASIRLNELLELGKLDGHEGFSDLKQRRPDLAWIFDKYSTIAEFLAVGGKTTEETVALWENTLGHKKLLSGGEFVWGCIYAQETFSVAIVAY